MPLVRYALAGSLWLFASATLHAQSLDLLQSFQRFEELRAGTDAAAVVNAGRQALQRADAEGFDDPHTRADLHRGIGAALLQSGDNAGALEQYQQALALQTRELGADDHPDLVPLLTDIAEVQQRLHSFDASIATLQRVLEIERAAHGDRNPAIAATLQKLRDVHRDAGHAGDVERLDQLIEVQANTPRAVIATPDPANRYQQNSQGFATVRVFYGTNRARTTATAPAAVYGAGRGELQVGYLDVTIPATHRQGELETQSRWSVYTLFADKATLKRRYVMLDRVTPLARDAWLDALRGQVRGAPSRDVFVFVHGYNSSFEDAARRTAQLAYDLDFDGTPLMYSWPSQASTTAYTVDEAAVNISGRRLAQFLEDVAARTGAGRIHLIEALQTWMAGHDVKSGRRAFGQVVFTAPDVDRDYFQDVIDTLAQTAERVTLYASDSDLALMTSQKVHGAPRAGTAGSSIITRKGLDTIDMSSVRGDMLGHSYFAADAGAIYDLFRLLWRGDPPPQRCGMSSHAGPARSTVWLFNVDMCRGQDLLEAGVLLKRFGGGARKRVVDRIASLQDPDQKQQWSRILQRLDTLLKPLP